MKLNVLFILLMALMSFGSSAQNELDAKLEQYIRNDEFEKAKLHVKNTLLNISNGPNDEYIYYNAKAGFIYLRLGVIDSALYFSRNAVNNIQLSSKDEFKHEAWKSIAYSYCQTGKLDSAAVYTQKLYAEVKNSGKHEMIRYAYILMGIISFQNKLFHESLEYYEKALESTNFSKNTNNYKVDYYNLGLTHSVLKNYQQGIDYFVKALQFAENSNDKRLLCRIYGSMADNYLGQGDESKRLYYLDKANLVAKSIGDKNLIAMGANHEIEKYYIHGNYKKAFSKGTETSELMRDENLPHLQVKHDTLMYALAKKNNQTDKALEYLESFTKNKIKLLEQNGRKQIDEIKIKYESEKKDLLISNQKLEILASKRIHKITFLIIVLFCIVFVFLFLAYQKKKRTVHLIYKKEKEKDFEIKKLQERLSSYSLIKTHRENHKVEQEIPKPDKHINDKDNSYPLEKSAELFELFITRLESEKLYLEPDIDQNRIVTILGTNKKYLYEAISKHSDLNFRGIINRFRIKESKSTIEQKLKENETLNLSAIYTECGFNSNSSFYRTFKLITGITPNDYALELKKEL